MRVGADRASESIAALSSCPHCGSEALRKWGIERNGRYPRQRYKCDSGHLMMEPRIYPLGPQFQSEPWKLLKAIRLMKSGRKSLQKIADAAELNRYTIYKLHNYLGRPFACVCGRKLGHQGHCKPMFDKSAAIRKSFDQARNNRKISKPSLDGWLVAERALERAIAKLQEMNDDQ